MFQEGQAAQSDRMMKGVVRKNPNYGGPHLNLPAPESVDHTLSRCSLGWGTYFPIRIQTL